MKRSRRMNFSSPNRQAKAPEGKNPQRFSGENFDEPSARNETVNM